MIRQNASYHMSMQNKGRMGAVLLALTLFSTSIGKTQGTGFRLIVITSDGQITQGALSANVVIDFTTSPPSIKALPPLLAQKFTFDPTDNTWNAPAFAHIMPAGSKIAVFRNGVRTFEGKEYTRVSDSEIRQTPTSTWVPADDIEIDVYR